MKADLHMHSTSSDGLYTPKELFQMAQKNGVDIISITDHDNMSDIVKNYEYAEQYKVKYIPGIELSTIEQERSVHILGYFTDDSYNSTEIKNYFTEIKTRREKRARTFIHNLKVYYNLDVNYEDAYKFGKGIIARPHIAKAIRVNYPEYTHDYIFDNFIGDHCEAYVPSSLLKVDEGIELLRRHNCVVILAHPKLLKKHIKDNVMSKDVDGYEAIYYQNTEEETEFFKTLALKKGLLYTAGSDFHGIPNDTKHGVVGDCTLEGEMLDKFLSRFKK